MPAYCFFTLSLRARCAKKTIRVTSELYYNGREKSDPWRCEAIPGLECEEPPSESEKEKESDEEYNPEEDPDR